ncbi:MAG: hypothetical protein IJ656_03380 [Bacilli bacterium]|nr:hypothetical protein [Bacilli bacterium]MBR1582055.1 hypothetical protein [Bacilli bacterium]
MFKSVLGMTLAALIGVGAAHTVPQNNVRRAFEPLAETVDVYGTHNYFTGDGGVFNGNGNALLKDQVEGDITYTRLTNANGADNCYLLMDNEEKHAGNYIFTAKMRVSEGFTDENIGFGFWAGGRIKDTTISSQLKAGEWTDVEVRFEFNEDEASKTDSIHMWILLAGGHIDFYDMQFRQLFVGNLGENIFKDEGFENVDLSGGDRTGWNDRHSGVIGCKANQLLWTSEGEGDEKNQFLRMRYTGEGDVQFVDFCSFFNDYNGSWPKGIEAGEYYVEMDVRTNDLFDSDNVGFAFYSSAGPRIERDFTPQVKAAKKGEWTHITYRYPDLGVELTQAYADGVDTIQFWANSKNIVGWNLDIDNVTIRKVTLAVDERPEFDGGVYSFQWVEADDEDVVITLKDLHGHEDLKILSGEYELLKGEEYTLSGNTLTIKKEFLADYDDGVHEFKAVTSGGERAFTIEVTHIQEDLPSIEDYELEETVFGGDFKDLDVGYRMSADQTQYAWGAVSQYDDGGLVIEETDGSRALQFKKPADSTKAYSSSFVIYHPEKIVENTIVTMEFDYKYVGNDTDGAVNVSWVGSSNVSYHLINLNGSKNAKTIEPEAKYRQWEIEYSEAKLGYTHVKVSMRIDAATVTATNSIRFLMKYNGQDTQELRITNMSLKKWVKSLGSITPVEATFNKAEPKDVEAVVKFADGLELYAVAIDGKTNYIPEENYVATPANTEGEYKLTIKKEYLATLANGEHTIYVSSSENASGEYAELELKLTVTGEAKGDEKPAPAKKGCGGSIVAVGGLTCLIAAIGVAVVALKKREEK